jgi:hypothetical protein
VSIRGLSSTSSEIWPSLLLSFDEATDGHGWESDLTEVVIGAAFAVANELGAKAQVSGGRRKGYRRVRTLRWRPFVQLFLRHSR